MAVTLVATTVVAMVSMAVAAAVTVAETVILLLPMTAVAATAILLRPMMAVVSMAVVATTPLPMTAEMTPQPMVGSSGSFSRPLAASRE